MLRNPQHPMKAKDTYYNGNYFRSRLEASWAVCFDELKVQYQYEPTKFELNDGSVYMPDFYFPKYEFYAEVKPFFQQDKRWFLFEAPLLLMFGKPHFDPMYCVQYGKEPLIGIPFADLWDPAYGKFRIITKGDKCWQEPLSFRTA